MELSNQFRVGVPVEQAWAVLTDVERIAPCLPGAQLQEVEGDEYRGVVKIKVGPITAQYKGTARMVSLDPQAHEAVLRAEGRDTRGQGNATATVTATLSAEAGGTSVSVVTDLTVTGKVAQFGRGVLAEVSAKLIGQFVDALERDVLSGPLPASEGAHAVAPEATPAPVEAGLAAAGAAPANPETGSPPAVDEPVTATAPEPAVTGNGSGPPASTVRRVDQPEREPVDLLANAGPSVARRVVPVVLVVILLILLGRARRRP
jgi:carbon monoxide dehydrogenase subunit G